MPTTWSPDRTKIFNGERYHWYALPSTEGEAVRLVNQLRDEGYKAEYDDHVDHFTKVFAVWVKYG